MNNIEEDLRVRNDLARQNPTLCMAPWNTLDFRYSAFSDQKIHTTCCCNLDTTKYKTEFRIDVFDQIKTQQNLGQWPESCWRCQVDESNGGQSERMRTFIQNLDHRVAQFLDNRTIDEFELRVKFSNFCNLSCRSCAETESSTFAKISNNRFDPKQADDLTNNSDYWQAITTSILDLQPRYNRFVVHCIGGETLVQPGMRKLLTWIRDQGIASKVGIRFTTALSVNPDSEFLDLLTEFAWVDIVLSIDSVGENYHYVRWPARFEKIDTHLSTLFGYRPSEHIENNQKVFKVRWLVHVSPVFSLNNFFYIKSWLDYWHRTFQQQGQSFHMFVATLTDQTKYLDIEALPWQYRSYLKQYLAECLEHVIFSAWPSADVRSVYNFIETTIKELDNRFDPVLWKRYLTLTAWFDEKTRTELAVFNNELWSRLDQEDKDYYYSKRQFIKDQAIPNNYRLHNVMYSIRR